MGSFTSKFECTACDIIIEKFNSHSETLYYNPKSSLTEEMFQNINQIITTAPEKSKTLSELCTYLKEKTENLSEIEKAWLTYRYITENIKYDSDRYKNNNDEISEDEIFKNGICRSCGYAKLFSYIGKFLNLDIVNINGYIKAQSSKIGKKFDNANNYWNAVKINGNWYLIDCTFGAGSVDEKFNFVKDFDDYYFCTNPLELILSHYPLQEQWQLIPKTKSMEDFEKTLKISKYFFKLGFKKVNPELDIINLVDNKTEIKISYDVTKNLHISATLTNVENCNGKKIQNTINITRFKKYFSVNVFINKKGEYFLYLFGKDDEMEKFEQLTVFKIINENDSTQEFFYPKKHSDIIEIIKPLNNNLIKGNYYDFKFIQSEYDALYLKIGSQFIEMNKKNKIFEEKEIFVHDKVKINFKNPKDGKYHPLIEYNVVENPDKKITFPNTYKCKKNILIEPICNTLKKGENITFKLRCDLNLDFYINDEEVTKFQKNGNIFTANTKIDGKKGDVAITYKDLDTGNKGKYEICYSYNVIE